MLAHLTPTRLVGQVIASIPRSGLSQRDKRNRQHKSGQPRPWGPVAPAGERFCQASLSRMVAMIGANSAARVFPAQPRPDPVEGGTTAG
jgi:hypothetical protein